MNRHILVLGIALFATMAPAADVVVSQVPMAKASSQPVSPNLLFVLDDSGSMGWDYTPDYVDDSKCRSTASITSLTSCAIGHPPYMAGTFNKQYYNPRIRYSPGMKADGVSYPDMTSATTSAWTQVPNNGYSTSSSKYDLVGAYTDRKYCTSGTYTSCKANTTYAYPDNTYTAANSTTFNTGAYYYNIKPLYCSDEGATNCVKVSDTTHQLSVPFRWCKSGTFTDCKAKNDSTYKYPSFIEPETAAKAVGSFKVNTSGNSKTLTLSIIGGSTYALLSSWNSGSSGNGSTAAVAVKVKDAINANSGRAYDASCADGTCSTSIVTITARNTGATYNGTISNSGSISLTSKVNPAGGMDGALFFERVNIVSGTTKYQVDGAKPNGRTDCITYTDGCSYAEEMTNFANWYAYYRTRILAMKSAVSIAFKDIDNRFRIGYTQINSLSGKYVNIKAFDTAQRTTWYDKLLTASASGNTPLREAMSFAGRVFAGKKPSGISDDPMQYSCQQNFTLLTTDGYWNGPGGDTSGTGVVDLNNNKIGDMDGGTTEKPYYEGPTASSTSLADTAMYYYQTDLRTSNCTSPSTGADVCENNVPISADDKNQTQHMTTYTLGLGVDGQLTYRSDYKTALSGDFQKIKTGALNWPVPAANSETAVDDLWHAAVNGRGQYFSAQDPAVLVSSLKEALASISTQFGSGAAAATSNLEPVSGDNYIYVATYTTGKWTGNLEARQIDLSNGQPKKQCIWAAEDVPADTVAQTTACTGTMAAKVGLTSDTRKIYFNRGGTITEFKPSNVGAADKAKFDVTKLSQYVGWSPEYKAAANADLMIDYMRGQTGYDTRTGNTYRFFRQRDATLGDIVDSKPVFVCKPQFSYTDPGYATFKASFSGSGTCKPIIYVGANDGMLHAFNASTGQEEWAFIPTPALSEMWRIADSTYSVNHRFFVDGAPHINHVCIANCDSEAAAVWKTILIGSLGYGVVQGDDPDTGAAYSGYYALDITDPNVPKLLWEINSQSPAYTNMIGFTPNNVAIGKVETGAGTQWAAVFASGYKPGDGKTRVFIVNAYSGANIRNVTLPATADGLSRISVMTTDSNTNATFTYVYGGDLKGNVWRINANTGATALVFNASGKPFTTRPEISLCNGKAVIYIGSGKFFEAADLTDKSTQTFYGFVDDYDTSGTLSAGALSSLSITGSGTTRSIGSSSGNPMGWYADLPDVAAGVGGSERINIDPVLQAGTLVFQSNVPEEGICLASGHSWTNVMQLRSCTATDKVHPVSGGTSQHAGNELGVGITIVKIGGTYVPIVTGSGGSVKVISGIPIGQSDTSPKGIYTGWRELIRN